MKIANFQDFGQKFENIEKKSIFFDFFEFSRKVIFTRTEAFKIILGSNESWKFIFFLILNILLHPLGFYHLFYTCKSASQSIFCRKWTFLLVLSKKRNDIKFNPIQEYWWDSAWIWVSIFCSLDSSPSFSVSDSWFEQVTVGCRCGFRFLHHRHLAAVVENWCQNEGLAMHSAAFPSFASSRAAFGQSSLP